MSPARWQRLPSPRRQYTVGVAAGVLFVLTMIMFVDQPSWLVGLAAGSLLLAALASFGSARRRARQGPADLG